MKEDTIPAHDETARLLFPAIRWDREAGSFEAYRTAIDEGLERGVGGFIIFGGPAEAVRELTAELRSRSRHPLLIGADLERGAGQQFEGATALPPPGALAEIDDVAVTRRAGELTGREALSLGINWVYAPVADLDNEPENPIVGTRAFSGDPDVASRHVAAWIEGCAASGALSCAKHFPGHGRTTSDSHLDLPRVDADRATLDAELAAFRAALEAGVPSIMSAHVAYPALDPSGGPATLSRPILTELLREELGFDGLVVTDALIMEGVTGGGGSHTEAAVRAVAAGCDALLYPPDPGAVAEALEAARGTDALPESRVAAALERIRSAASRLERLTRERASDEDPGRRWGRSGDQEWALAIAGKAVRPLRGRPAAGAVSELLVIDDDVGGPFAPPPRRFAEALASAGVQCRPVRRPTGEYPVVVGLYADIKGFKGRPGLSQTAIETLASVIDVPLGTTVVLFGPPRLAAQVPGAHVLCAWGGEPLMEHAAARHLAGGRVAGPQSSSPR